MWANEHNVLGHEYFMNTFIAVKPDQYSAIGIYPSITLTSTTAPWYLSCWHYDFCCAVFIMVYLWYKKWVKPSEVCTCWIHFYHSLFANPQQLLLLTFKSFMLNTLSASPVYTVYPKKYAHGFVVLCFVVVMQSFIMNSHEVFIHIHQGCFAGTGAIVRLPQCQWSKPDGYGKISQCITTTMHSKAKTVCIFLGIYCTRYPWLAITAPADVLIPHGARPSAEKWWLHNYTYSQPNVFALRWYWGTFYRMMSFKMVDEISGNLTALLVLRPGPRFNIKMTSYRYRKSHCGDKMVVRLSYLHNGISYTDKMSSLYWIRA